MSNTTISEFEKIPECFKKEADGSRHRAAGLIHHIREMLSEEDDRPTLALMHALPALNDMRNLALPSSAVLEELRAIYNWLIETAPKADFSSNIRTNIYKDINTLNRITRRNITNITIDEKMLLCIAIYNFSYTNNYLIKHPAYNESQKLYDFVEEINEYLNPNMQDSMLSVDRMRSNESDLLQHASDIFKQITRIGDLRDPAIKNTIQCNLINNESLNLEGYYTIIRPTQIHRDIQDNITTKYVSSRIRFTSPSRAMPYYSFSNYYVQESGDRRVTRGLVVPVDTAIYLIGSTFVTQGGAPTGIKVVVIPKNSRLRSYNRDCFEGLIMSTSAVSDPLVSRCVVMRENLNEPPLKEDLYNESQIISKDDIKDYVSKFVDRYDDNSSDEDKIDYTGRLLTFMDNFPHEKDMNYALTTTNIKLEKKIRNMN